MKAGRSR